MANPCGLSHDRTLGIIEHNVLYGKYNGRDEVMKGLMSDGFTYDEARQVSDYYYKVYSRLSGDFKIKKPKALLNAKEKLDKKVNNLSIAYLNGELQSFPMEEYDFDALQKIFEKEAAADTPSLKGKYIEEANVFVQKFLPDYTNELFKSSVYARPLLSSVFFIKSFTSNFFAQLQRSIVTTLFNGKKADFTSLSKFNDLANASFSNVLKGGIPATSLYQSEAGFDPTRGRLEEFSIEGTGATSNKAKAAYFSVMKFMSKWSNRFNSAPDTRGIFHNAERHMYQLLKEKYRDLGMDNDQANQKAMEEMELNDKAEATKMAEAKFRELGIEAYGDKGGQTSEFKVAVAEYQRMDRDDVLWRNALLLAKNDFWKKNLTIKTEMGFGDYGLFGLKAQVMVKVREAIEKHSNNKLASAFNLSAFGFINGAANFAEDALERFPLYAAIKLKFLQNRKKTVTDQELLNDIQRRQRDIIAKNVTTVSFFLAAKMLESLICPDKSGKAAIDQVSSGRTQIGVCGIPLFVPPQMMAMYKFYNIIWKATENDEEFFSTTMNLLPVLIQSNQIGLGGSVDKVGGYITNSLSAGARHDNIRQSEEWGKAVKETIKFGANYANTFLPLPSRLTSEVGVVAQRVQGINQKQMDLPFAIDESGKRLGLPQTIMKVTIASLGNVTGISDISIAAMGSNKEYAVDWQGRKVMQFRGSDITGNGIQYNYADDILATAGVKAPYVYRLEKIGVSNESETKLDHLGKITVKDSKKRYMTDSEYFNVSEALGRFNEEYFRENGNDIVKFIKNDKELEGKAIESVFKKTKGKAIEAVERGIKSSSDIYFFVKRNWESKRSRSTTESSVEEE